jgi:hypothetical protein
MTILTLVFIGQVVSTEMIKKLMMGTTWRQRLIVHTWIFVEFHRQVCLLLIKTFVVDVCVKVVGFRFMMLNATFNTVVEVNGHKQIHLKPRCKVKEQCFITFLRVTVWQVDVWYHLYYSREFHTLHKVVQKTSRIFQAEVVLAGMICTYYRYNHELLVSKNNRLITGVLTSLINMTGAKSGTRTSYPSRAH